MGEVYCEKLATALAVTKAGTSYTGSGSFETSAGYTAVLIVSTAGSITVTQQCSVDNSNWYDPVATDASALGAVCSALTVTTGTYIKFDPVVAPYIRFKIVEGNIAASAVTITLVNQEA